MRPQPLPLLTLRDLGRAVLRWSAQWVYIARLAAQIMAWALSPGSYPRALRPVMARHLYQSAGPALWWYVLMFGLFSLVLVQIVVVSAQSYGLSMGWTPPPHIRCATVEVSAHHCVEHRRSVHHEGYYRRHRLGQAGVSDSRC